MGVGLNSIYCEGVLSIIVFIIRAVYLAYPQTCTTLNTSYISVLVKPRSSVFFQPK